MTEARAEEHKGAGLSLEKAAKMLGVDERRVDNLAGQGRRRASDGGAEGDT